MRATLQKLMRIERECPFRLDDAIPKTRLKTGASGLRQQPRAGRAEFFALPAAFAVSPIRRFAAFALVPREIFHLLLMTTIILSTYGHNGARRIRFQNRR